MDAAAHGGRSAVERAGGAGRVGVAVGPVGGADGSRGGGCGEGFDQQAAGGAAQEGPFVLAAGTHQTEGGAVLTIAGRQKVAKPCGVLGQRAEQDVQGGGHGAEGMGGGNGLMGRSDGVGATRKRKDRWQDRTGREHGTASSDDQR